MTRPGAMIAVNLVTEFAALPAEALALMAADSPDTVFTSPTWFRTVIAHALPTGATPLFLIATRADRAVGLLALRLHGRTLESLTTPYSCAFAPLLCDRLDRSDRVATCAALAEAALHATGRARSMLRLDALDPDDPRVTDLILGARDVGLAVRRFNHFGNWREDVAGLSWADYLARRPGPLRNTIRRRTVAATRRNAALSIVHDTTDLEDGVAGYEEVYGRSWKQAEPFPTFNAALIRALAPLGQLRLGLMRLEGQVVAAQIWLVAQGVATVVKLAHDEAFKAISPGTILTAHVLRHLLEREQVRAIDFGRGDDAYKQDWAGQRRQRIGLLLIDPRRPAGLLALARQSLGQALRRATRRNTPVRDG